jgi:hypothetical protein
MIQDNMENMMTYDQYIKDEVDKYKFYTSQDYIKTELEKYEKLKQQTLQESRYINVTITIDPEPFDYECKRDEYNTLVDDYNTLVNEYNRILNEFSKQLQTHPLYNNQIPIIDDIVDEKQLIVEPVVNQIQPFTTERTIDGIEFSTDHYFYDLYRDTYVYFHNKLRDESVHNDVETLLDILIKSLPYRMVKTERVYINMHQFDCNDEGLLSRLKHNDYNITNTMEHIINDYRDGVITSPCHIRNMIIPINKYIIQQYLNFPDKYKSLFKQWYDVFNNLCKSYQQNKKNERCINIPENIDTILIQHLTGYIKQLFNEDQKEISMETFNEISSGFDKIHTNRYVLPLYFSMFLLYSPVRPNVLQELYFNPSSDQNGFSLDQNGSWYFHHNQDKNVNENNATKTLIENEFIIQLLDTILSQKSDEDNDNLIYTFKVNGQRNQNFNSRIFRPCLKLLGDTDNCIRTYNDIRTLYSTRDLNKILDGSMKRKHNISTMLSYYYTKFGNRIE